MELRFSLGYNHSVVLCDLKEHELLKYLRLVEQIVGTDETLAQGLVSTSLQVHIQAHST